MTLTHPQKELQLEFYTSFLSDSKAIVKLTSKAKIFMQTTKPNSKIMDSLNTYNPLSKFIKIISLLNLESRSVEQIFHSKTHFFSASSPLGGWGIY